MSDTEKKTMFIKISLIDTFNQILEYVDKKIQAGEEVPRNLEVLDMKFQLICSHLDEIAKRALVLKDPLQITHLVALKILEESKPNSAEEKFDSTLDPKTEGNA